jgi:hypothetical protein
MSRELSGNLSIASGSVSDDMAEALVAMSGSKSSENVSKYFIVQCRKRRFVFCSVSDDMAEVLVAMSGSKSSENVSKYFIVQCRVVFALCLAIWRRRWSQ